MNLSNQHSFAQAGAVFDDYADVWGSFYDSDSESGRAFDYRNRQRTLLELVDRFLRPQADILEFGCGAGQTAALLASRGHRLSCLDISPKMVEATHRTLSASGLTANVACGTLHDVSYPPASFDAVVAMGVMEYVPDHEATLRRVYELLRPGGISLLSFTNADSPFLVFEAPLRRVVGRFLHVLTHKEHYRNIADSKGRLNRLGELTKLHEQCGFAIQSTRFYSYGFRLSSWWLPPLFVVRRLDAKLNHSRLSDWGRGFILVARKPSASELP